jgi:hypothetical protein
MIAGDPSAVDDVRGHWHAHIVSKQLIAQLGRAHTRPSIRGFNFDRHTMSKRTRHADNSKRQQPIQQQRAEAARQATSQNKVGRRSDQQRPQERAGDEPRR